MKRYSFYISEDGRKYFLIEIPAATREDAVYAARKRYPDSSVKVIFMGVKI